MLWGDMELGETRSEMTTDKDNARAFALDFTRTLARSWQEHLGPQLLGAYLIGSLAHGGFNRRYSDIDMALVTEDGLDDGDLDTMKEAAIALSSESASKLSIFWADRYFSTGRFPPLDRVDFVDHGVALVEAEAVRPRRPSLTDIRAYLRGAPFENWANSATAFAALDSLESKDYKPYLRAHLYPARFIYSWVTGRMASNDDAVAFIHENCPVGLNVDLVARALQCRKEARDPDTLFTDRKTLPRQIDACARSLSTE